MHPMDGRAASQTITDKIPYLMNRAITPIVLSGVSGKHDDRFQHRQLLPWGPAGLRFDLRYVIRMKFGKGFLYRLLIGVIGLASLSWTLKLATMLARSNHEQANKDHHQAATPHLHP